MAGCQTTQSAKCEPASAATEPAAAAEAPADRPKMARPANLPGDVRASVAKTMKDHSDDVTLLMWSILFLDVDGAGEYAEEIAVRPVDLTDEERAKVPNNILRLHGELRSKAQQMAALSKQGRSVAPEMAKALGDMTSTCVACHQAYLYPPAASE